MGIRIDALDDENVLANENLRNKQLSFVNFKVAIKHGGRFIINLCLVYFLEYVVLTGFGNAVSRKGYLDMKDNSYIYESLALSYQIGVFISRSCLCVLQYIGKVEIITALQFINLVCWLVEALTGFFTSAWLGFSWMVFVGLMGGSSYVLCFAFILKNNNLPEEYKELTINVGTIFNDFGVFMASIVKLIFDNTIMN
jgi:battenin